MTDDPQADLVAIIRGKAEMAATRPDLMPGLISAMRTHPLINDAMRDRYTVGPLRDAVARVLSDDDPAIDLIAELVPSVALHRVTLLGEDLDPEAFTQEVLAMISRLSTGDAVD